MTVSMLLINTVTSSERRLRHLPIPGREATPGFAGCHAITEQRLNLPDRMPALTLMSGTFERPQLVGLRRGCTVGAQKDSLRDRVSRFHLKHYFSQCISDCRRIDEYSRRSSMDTDPQKFLGATSRIIDKK